MLSIGWLWAVIFYHPIEIGYGWLLLQLAFSLLLT